ncbi:hypothetical protein D3C73_1514180 [compost metagenome]
MMHAGDEILYGPTADMMTDGELARLYGVPFVRHTGAVGRPDIVSPILGQPSLHPKPRTGTYIGHDHLS